MVFVDRASIQPFVSEVADFEKLPEILTCEGTEETHECYLTVNFPKITDDLVKSTYSYEMDPITSKRRQKDRPDQFDGYKITGVDMGCRKIDQKLKKLKKKLGVAQVLCMTGVDDGETVNFEAATYTCGCTPERCFKGEGHCKLLERKSCNQQFILPNDVYSYVFHRKEEILRSFRRAEEL